MEKNNKKIILDDHLLSYYHFEGEREEGVSLVCLHGWGLDSETWFSSIEALLPLIKEAIAIDLPGFGHSENPHSPFSMKEYTDIVESLLSTLDLQKVVIMGHSFGARIAVRLAIRQKSMIEKLVLVDAAGVRTHQVRAKVFSFLSRFFKPFVSYVPFLRTFALRFTRSDYDYKPALKPTFIKIVQESDIPLYPEVTTPTLLVWGDKDTITPLSSARIMEKMILCSELFVIEGAGHVSFLDKHKIFITKVISYLSQ